MVQQSEKEIEMEDVKSEKLSDGLGPYPGITDDDLVNHMAERVPYEEDKEKVIAIQPVFFPMQAERLEKHVYFREATGDKYALEPFILLKGNPGDWVITGIGGQRFVVTQEYFDTFYQPMEPEEKCVGSVPLEDRAKYMDGAEADMHEGEAGYLTFEQGARSLFNVYLINSGQTFDWDNLTPEWKTTWEAVMRHAVDLVVWPSSAERSEAELRRQEPYWRGWKRPEDRIGPHMPNLPSDDD